MTSKKHNGPKVLKKSVLKIYKKHSNCILEIESKIEFKKKELGSSISCSGVCLTLEKFNGNEFYALRSHFGLISVLAKKYITENNMDDVF